MKVNLTDDDINHVASLANLNLSDSQISKFQQSVQDVIEYMSKVQQINTDKIDETASVANLENVTREDKVDESRMLSQAEALSGAKRKHEGYFVVPAILEE